MVVFESITIANDKNSFAALVTCIQDLNLTASVSQHHILNYMLQWPALKGVGGRSATTIHPTALLEKNFKTNDFLTAKMLQK